jgi:PhzF family phenazine biosynthesis protein
MATPSIHAEVLRYAAFTASGRGGNPAGVVLAADGLDAVDMQAIAADVGYSETAFLRARSAVGERRRYDVRYFTPQVEVPFCGHATIAAAVALAERDGPAPLSFHAAAGEVPVDTRADGCGGLLATLTTVAPHVADVADADVAAALTALAWAREELDPRLPPRMAFAGARHLVLALETRCRLADLDYDFDALARVLERLGAITLALLWRESELVLHARNPAPGVGIVEDPATGAAAAAVGAYLASLGEVTPPATLVIRQGEDMGRPSRLDVELDPSQPGIRVSGAACVIRAPDRSRPRVSEAS